MSECKGNCNCKCKEEDAVNQEAEDVIIKKFDIFSNTEEAEKEASKLLKNGYELFNTHALASNKGITDEMILVFKKKPKLN